LLVAGQVAASKAVLDCVDEIALGARLMAAAISAGARLYYVAAGSSGLMAAADAMELKGTFGIPPSQVRILMAGGIPQTADMPGDVEDATVSLGADLAEISEADCMIVVSASGSTPYALEAAGIARRAGAPVISIVNNAHSPLSELSDHTIFIDTPPEQVSGSTRLGAGTAQKIALNTLSTLMGVELGHVHRGMMVNLLADNAKLRARAAGIVQQVANVDEETAGKALLQAGGNVKTACMLAMGASTQNSAKDALAQSGGRLDRAIEYLGLK
jgi:N-acetylmuramic acid 6-phosphate etherase